MIAIGRVFSTSLAQFRRRFWQLCGMWAVFFAIQVVGLLALGLGISLMGMAGMAAFGDGFEDLGALASMGLGMITFVALFYGALLALVLAQQAASVTLASPLEAPAFGAALMRGFKSVLPFLGLGVILILANIGVSLGLGFLSQLLAFGGEGAAGVLRLVLGVLLLPAAIYVACRLAVIIPVVAVDEVYNPVKALRRSWSVTRGKVIGIALVLIGNVAIGLAAIGVPFAFVFATVDTSPATALILPLVLLPLFILYTLFVAAVTAALHAEVTDGGAGRLEEVFA